jgi:hypothetical protein
LVIGAVGFHNEGINVNKKLKMKITKTSALLHK